MRPYHIICLPLPARWRSLGGRMLCGKSALQLKRAFLGSTHRSGERRSRARLREILTLISMRGIKYNCEFDTVELECRSSVPASTPPRSQTVQDLK